MIVFFLMQVCAVAQAQLRIEITEGGDNPTPIAIVPFSWSGEGLLKEDLAGVVAADMGRSGQFKPMARAEMLSQPSASGEVFYRDWRIMGVDYLVVGRITPVPPSPQASSSVLAYRVNYELMDVRAEKSVASWKIASVTDLRAAAHHISDTVYQKLTGLRGVFSTKLMYISVVRDRAKGKVYKLQVADADGQRAQTLFQSTEPVMSPVWSPDGKRIAYVSFATGRPAIYIQNRLTGKKVKLTDFKGINGAPDWSPDGQKMAMVLSKDGNPEIYIMNLKTRDLRRLTHHYAIDTEPRWTKDGASLVFTSNRGGSPQVYKVDAVTGRVIRLTFRGNYNARAQMSPDGHDLVMVHRENEQFHISVQNLQRDLFANLTKTSLDESPSISPNGSMVIYATQHNNKGVLGAVAINGNIKYLLPALRGEVREPVWSPYLN
ncbi:MAG: Tol-Pal system beta propeller repeat protein TolB [Gammaproteobacteria bacterium]|nr:Tol-Pal system beta propeller repeat protein TolB [Gammaproteobacteria bacterium]